MYNNFPLFDKPSITVQEIYALYKTSMCYPYDNKIVGIFTDKNLLELALSVINVSNSNFKFYYETYEPNKIGD